MTGRARTLAGKALPWALTAALLTGAWLIAVFTPPEDAAERIFVTPASVGSPAAGRNLAITVHDVRAAEAIAVDGWRAAGTWIVVDLDAGAVVSQEDGQLSTALLHIGDRTFRATERGPSDWSLLRASLVPGVPQSGSLAFELPADALSGTATLELSTSADTRYDSVIVLPIDLDALEAHDELELAPADWTRR